MTPRDIDALLAEHLFDLSVAGEECAGPLAADGGWTDLPHYSSTWEGLGLVVEAMEAKGWGVWMATKEVGVGWDVGFEKGDQRASVIEDAPLPMVAALAALKALGVEVPK